MARDGRSGSPPSGRPPSNGDRRRRLARELFVAASAGGSAETLRGLIAAGVDLNAVNERGRTALIVASAAGRALFVSLLLSAGSDVNRGDERGETALIAASQRGSAECVSALLEAGANVNQAMQIGATALHLACAKGHVECVRVLLKAGANVKQATQNGWTALHGASSKDNVECTRVLLEAGANVEQADVDGDTALMYATALGLLQLLCTHGAQRAPLLASEELVSALPAESLAWLLETARWTSPLHHLELLQPARVRELLRAGADVHASDCGADAPTPLKLAQAALLQAGAAGHEGAQLVVDAALPWSRHTHELFPLAARRRAAELLAVGQLLAKQPQLAKSGVAFIDVWTQVVMAHAVLR